MATAIQEPGGLTAEAVLVSVTAARQVRDRAEADILAAAADWADLHPGLDPDWIATLIPDTTVEGSPLAGDGTPQVDERCLAELGAALGRSTDSARSLVGDALELRHRLPRLWRAVLDCRVAVYVARDVALMTRELSRETVEFVDRQLALLPTVTSRRAFRLVDAAIARFMPDRAEAQRLEQAERRRVDINSYGRTDGLADVHGVLDLADAIDLDAALTDRAAVLGRLGVDGSLNVRRSIALGDLARISQDTLHLEPDAGDHDDSDDEGTEGQEQTEEQEQAETGRRVPGRQVMLYVHLSEAALTGRNEVSWLSHATGGAAHLVDTPILSGQVRDWLQRPDAKVSVRPVIDLNEPVLAPGYRVPERIKERLQLRDRHCIFPWCTRQRVDADHTIPHDQGGPTSTDNLAPLCRKHHRHKTFTRWRYRMIRPGVYLWTSTMGRKYLRDTVGTYPLE